MTVAMVLTLVALVASNVTWAYKSAKQRRQFLHAVIEMALAHRETVLGLVDYVTVRPRLIARQTSPTSNN